MRLVAGIIVVVFALFSHTFLNAQEVKYLDLTIVPKQAEPRYPPVSPTNCETVPYVGAMSAGSSVGSGASETGDVHALGVYLEHVSPTDISPAKPFEADFKVLNTGRAPIELPVAAHLSDLQPSHQWLPLEYFSLALVVRVAGVPQGPELVTYASVELNGSTDREGTMLLLMPGEWVRVKANVKLRQWPLKPVDAQFRGEFWFYKNTFQPKGGCIDIQNPYSLPQNHTPTPWITVHLRRPTEDQQQQ